MNRRTETALGLLAIVATVSAAVVLGPYVRTPTGGRQLDQNKSGSVTMLQRIFDQCGEPVRRTVPSFRVWVPKRDMDKADKVFVKTGELTTEIAFSRESCGSLKTLASIGAPMVCVRECADQACLVATTPDSEAHFGTSSVAFMSEAGKVILTEKFDVRKSQGNLPEAKVSVERVTLSVQNADQEGRPRGTAYFPALGHDPDNLVFDGGVAKVRIPEEADSFRVFVQRSAGAFEGIDLHIGPVDNLCGK
jgi:hypothetical protein